MNEQSIFDGGVCPTRKSASMCRLRSPRYRCGYDQSGYWNGSKRLTGVVFYWAEGSKPKPWNHAEQFGFTNLDVTTILIMRDWLERYCAVRPTDITYDLYIHAGANVVGAQEFWLRNLGIEPDRLRTYFKRNNPSPRRRNVGREYHGIMRMRVKRSTGLNHRVSGWIQAVTRYCGVV